MTIERKILLVALLFLIFLQKIWAIVEKAKNNGDIYIVSEETFLRNHHGLIPKESTTTEPTESSTNRNVNPDLIDFNAVISMCNSSFSIPMDYYITFNTTAELPNVEDKTGMCFIRCFYEKSRILENWQLNRTRIQMNIWPATGDTIEVCQNEGAKEKNPCVRAYAIGKCLTIRALVDAPSKPN
uniref:Uncharacterized protein n=1 Tax=Stomoxys calcitrans TaxID=35570 RepID=A0A1I8PGB7_STOCA